MRTYTTRSAAVAAATLMLWLGACARVSSREVAGPTPSETHYSVDCTGDQAHCYDEAAKRCPDGYEIVDSVASNKRRTWWVAKGEEEGVGEHRGQVLVKCKPVGSAAEEAPPDDDDEGGLAKALGGPLGAGGFEFGSSASDVVAECERAGFEAESSEKTVRCSGTAAPIGAEADADIGLCGGRACIVRLEVKASGSATTERLMQLRKALVEKYGKPGEHEVDVPPECRSDETADACFREGRAKLRYEWTWDDGSAIVLTLAARPSGNVTTRITYAAPKELRTQTSGL